MSVQPLDEIAERVSQLASQFQSEVHAVVETDFLTKIQKLTEELQSLKWHVTGDEKKRSEMLGDIQTIMGSVEAKLQELLDSFYLFMNQQQKRQIEHNERIRKTLDVIDKELSF